MIFGVTSQPHPCHDRRPFPGRPVALLLQHCLFSTPAVRSALAPPLSRPRLLFPRPHGPAPCLSRQWARALSVMRKVPPLPALGFCFAPGPAGPPPLSRWSRSPIAWRGGWPCATPPSPSLSRRRGSASSWGGTARRARSR